MSERALGTDQQAVLNALESQKFWHVGCGWLYGTVSATTRIMDSLEKRGLLRSKPYGKYGKIYILKEMP